MFYTVTLVLPFLLKIRFPKNRAISQIYIFHPYAVSFYAKFSVVHRAKMSFIGRLNAIYAEMISNSSISYIFYNL